MLPMASPLVSRAPLCLSCIRRIVGGSNSFYFPTGHQVRGKKKLAKVSTVKVHLLQNVKGYGTRGAIVNTTPGLMRNIWYPQKRAEYVTTAKLKDLGTKDAVSEWDARFGSEMEVEIEEEAGKENDVKKVTPTLVEMEPVKPIELELMSPEQTADVLSSLLPPNIEFYRTPIPVKVEPPAKRLSPSIATNSAISAAATAAAPEAKTTKKPEKTSIYGSVSTSDIAANLKAILAEDEEGARVILSPEDITFVEETEDIDRVKHLGIFEVDIRPKGAPEAIRRTIQVNAQN